MSLSIQLCSIAVLVTILILLMRRKRITLSSQRIFRFILIEDLVICILKLLFRYRVGQNGGIIGFTEQMLGKCTAALMIVLLIFSYYYFIMDFYRHFFSVRAAFIAISGGALVSLTAAMVIPMDYKVTDGSEIYSYGIVLNILGITSLVLLIVGLIAMINHRFYSDRRKLNSFYLWFIMWMISFAFQYIMHVQVHEFFVAIGIMILFIKVENPESYTDRESGVFSEQFLPAYISHYYERYPDFSMLVIVPGQVGYNVGKIYNEDNLNVTRYHLVMNEITRYADRFSNSVVFRHANNNVTVLFENSREMKNASADITKRLSEEWFFDSFSANVNAIVYEIPRCVSKAGADELSELVRYFIRESSKISASKIITLDDEWLEYIKSEREMTAIISDAIIHDRIEVFYQPIYSTKEKRFVSAEALVRLRDGEGKIIMPGSFVPVAEKNGLIIELGRIVFRKACAFIEKNDLRSKGINYLEINLSAVQCVKEELAEQYIEIMDELEIDPSMINLEITESAALDSMDILIKNMQSLIDYGVEFSLDDFGTGYSNLNYIMDLPVSIVKFDKKMTNSYFESHRGKLVMESVINMIKAVGTKIVSEGVETKTQLETLEQACIDYIQGYYFSKPVSGDDFLELLKDNLTKKTSE